MLTDTSMLNLTTPLSIALFFVATGVANAASDSPPQPACTNVHQCSRMDEKRILAANPNVFKRDAQGLWLYPLSGAKPVLFKDYVKEGEAEGYSLTRLDMKAGWAEITQTLWEGQRLILVNLRTGAQRKVLGVISEPNPKNANIVATFDDDYAYGSPSVSIYELVGDEARLRFRWKAEGTRWPSYVAWKDATTLTFRECDIAVSGGTTAKHVVLKARGVKWSHVATPAPAPKQC